MHLAQHSPIPKRKAIKSRMSFEGVLLLLALFCKESKHLLEHNPKNAGLLEQVTCMCELIFYRWIPSDQLNQRLP